MSDAKHTIATLLGMVASSELAKRGVVDVLNAINDNISSIRRTLKDTVKEALMDVVAKQMFLAQELYVADGEVFVVPSDVIMYCTSVKVDGELYVDGELKVI